MLDLVWLIPALPLAGFLINIFFGKRIGEPWAGWIATAMMAAAFVVSCLVFAGLYAEPEESRVFVQTLFTWIPAGDFTVDVGLYVDPLSITMVTLMVTGVGTLIHLYSVGYMHGDPRFARFFAYLNLFAVSMLLLVLGDNLLLTFLGWEGVGACSYLLIGFWFEKPENGTAAKKAFVTNRVGDTGFLIAMFVTFLTFGSLNYSEVLPMAPGLAEGTAVAITLLLFVGAIGKSAQIPLFVWLPDAMAGPTPVSAFIHAATMVTAGVYLLCRMNPVVEASADWVPFVIALVGALTALLAATIALAQNDIKKVLAFSTVSQLGYMFLAVGSGAYVAAIFHMITHAFFKALLFLDAGSVIHGMHEEQDMRRMGGLRKLMPVTAVTMIIGTLAISGIPPFSGFWSKDEILAFALQEHPVLYAIGLFTAVLTAFYMGRLVIMTFYGDARWHDEPQASDSPVVHAEHLPEDFRPHESPPTMTVPLVVLAVLSTVAGFINLPFHGVEFLAEWLHPVFGGNQAELTLSGLEATLASVVSAVLCALGLGAAYLVYQRKRVDNAKIELPLFAKGWFIDSGLAAFMGGPGRAGFEGVATADEVGIDGAVNGVGTLTRGIGQRTRRIQSGFVRSYALSITVGAVLLLAFLLTRLVALG